MRLASAKPRDDGPASPKPRDDGPASPKPRDDGPASPKPREGGRALAALIGSVLAALLAAPVTAQRQEPPPTPTFRAGVELVQIDAVVVDANGNPVSGLTADDFELREEGKPRDISAFATVDIPIEQAARVLYSPTAIEPDVASNSADEGRLYVFAFDEIAADLALRTRHFLRRFIETHMGANDVAAIAYLSIGAANSQDFTASKRLLLTQLEKFTGGSAPSPAELNMQNRMATLRDLTQMLASIQGRRKAMLLVSTGDSLADSYDIVDNTGSSIATDYLREAMIAATRGNVVIYPIDPRGLTVAGATGEEESTPGGGASLSSLSNLRALARLTGGFAVTNTNRYEANFERVVRENSSYYILGFYSANDKRDGKFRSVDVRIKRPGLEVRARTGYVAPKRLPQRTEVSKTVLTADTTAALASALGRRDVPMKLFAASYKGEGKDAVVSVVVQVDPATLDLVERDGLLTGKLEIGITATNGRRRLPGVYHVADLNLKPETFEMGRREGVRIVSELLLPPGMYQVRAAAGNGLNKAGSVIADVEVPDFRKDPLRMSGVALSTAGLAPLTVRAGTIRAPLPFPPTTSREFSTGDVIEVFAEVYDNIRTNASHTVDVTTTLRADDGRVLMTRTEQRSSSELGGARGGFGFRAELPLTGVASGLYVIHVEARANTRDRPVVTRDVPIKIQ
jgi:VWFA-related protein